VGPLGRSRTQARRLRRWYRPQVVAADSERRTCPLARPWHRDGQDLRPVEAAAAGHRLHALTRAWCCGRRARQAAGAAGAVGAAGAAGAAAAAHHPGT